MLWFTWPVDYLACRCPDLCTAAWLTLLFVLIIVPDGTGGSLYIRTIYVKTLLKIFEWTSFRTEKRAKDKTQQNYNLCPREPHLSLQPERFQGFSSFQRSEPKFEMSYIFHFCQRGVESIVDDEVTKCFSAQELESWNLLTRSKNNFTHTSVRVVALWGLGVLIRYGLLLPLRIILFVTGCSLFLFLTFLLGFLPKTQLRSYLSEKVHVMGYSFCISCLTAIVTYHDRENQPKNGAICVANHTTPIDAIILASDRGYALVGQVHGGFLGMIQRAMIRSSPHIWFERAEVKDRHLVAKRLRDHVADESKQPILVFPEGTCVNNTSVMMFKKGSFEIGSTVYPVAIKYDPRFGDAFYDSSKFGLMGHLMRMMSSWAIVCSVWYLPPMNREEGEDAIQFANRVKATIAARGGLVDLTWDGSLKRAKVKDTLKTEEQKLYSKVLLGDHNEQSDVEHVESGNPGENKDNKQ